jgi:hypothetical protein
LITAKWIAPGDDLRAAEVVLQLRQRYLDSASIVTHRLLQISKFYEVIDDLSGGASTSELYHVAHIRTPVELVVSQADDPLPCERRNQLLVSASIFVNLTPRREAQRRAHFGLGQITHSAGRLDVFMFVNLPQARLKPGTH